jgi:hypothetical protein
MIKKNFFLTDVMKLGDHLAFEDFIKSNTLDGEEFTFTADYYRLHTFKLGEYHRRFAIIDHRDLHEEIWQNDEYLRDFRSRTEKLHELGFIFIIGHPWESQENVSGWFNFDNVLQGKRYMSWSGSTSWFWHMMHKKHRGKKYNFIHDHKKFDFLYLNKYPRRHRIFLYKKLKDNNLLNNSLYTFVRYNNRRLPAQYELPDLNGKDYPIAGRDQEIFEPPYNESSYHIVSETNDNDNDIFMTEKIWKPIMAKQPFIVHGNHGYLKKLREMGFKTFDGIIDESYDLEKDRNKKIDLITRSCQKLLMSKWKDVYANTKSQREHNYENFWNRESLKNEINKTVLGFLEFADRG